MTQPNKLFIFTNFDGTTFNTFEPSPSGIGVHQAYKLAVQDFFGDDGSRVYKNTLDGLQNREPGQLFDLITRELGMNERDIASEFGSRLQGIRSFVDAKLSHMLGDISPQWPKPYPGVLEFFRAVQNGKLPVEVCVASSGHRRFIEEVYGVNGLKPPEVMITSDEINGRMEPRRSLYRPHTYQIARLHYQMLGGLPEREDPRATRAERFLDRKDGVKDHAVFIGDHPTVDAGVAERARIPFLFVPNIHPNFMPDRNKGQFEFKDFSVLQKWIEDHREGIEGGRSASELFFEIPDSELFPPVAESERPYNVWLRTMRAIPAIQEEGELKRAQDIAESTGFPITPIRRGIES